MMGMTEQERLWLAAAWEEDRFGDAANGPAARAGCSGCAMGSSGGCRCPRAGGGCGGCPRQGMKTEDTEE